MPVADPCGPSPSPSGAGRSADEVSQGHIEGVRDEKQVVQERTVGSLLDPVHGLPVQAGGFGELFLGQFPLGADGADSVSDLASAGWYPGGQRIGWHAYTLVAAVISVCTILGTFPKARSGRSATPFARKHTFE